MTAPGNPKGIENPEEDGLGQSPLIAVSVNLGLLRKIPPCVHLMAPALM